ncbi:MAG: hypothetical protein AAF607_00650 [Pseudomonadota bacterium]
MLKMSISLAGLLSVAAISPATGGAMRDMDTACKLEIENRIGGFSDGRSARFKKQRGSGRIKRFIYSLTYANDRSDVLCLVSRNGVENIEFDAGLAARIAAAKTNE